jgi:hypothetical protein
MKEVKGEGFQAREKERTIRRAKFYPNKYPYASKLHIYFQLRGVKTSTVCNTLKNNGIPENTVKTFLRGSHIPSSYLSHLVEDIWGIRFSHEDFMGRV